MEKPDNFVHNAWLIQWKEGEMYWLCGVVMLLLLGHFLGSVTRHQAEPCQGTCGKMYRGEDLLEEGLCWNCSRQQKIFKLYRAAV